MQPRNIIDSFRDEDGHDERVRADGADVGELDVELFPVMIQPPSGELRANFRGQHFG